MNAQILTFSANEQTLIKTGGIDDFASNTVRYAKATFTLGTNWTGFDSVRAVWKTACYTISTVLDANHSCDVPPEVLSYKAKVYVNLVGSISENGVLTDRLTTFPVLAMHIKSNAPVEGTETAPITASQFEQFVETVQDAADSISDYSYDSEAWAVGKRGGVDVPSTDETYHNNSKYWAEQNAGLSDDVADLKSDIDALENGSLNYTEGYGLNADGTLVATEGVCVSDYIPVSGSTGYLSASSAESPSSHQNLRVIEYAQDKSFVDYWSANPTKSFTTSANTRFVRFSFDTGFEATLTKYQTSEVIYKATHIESLDNRIDAGAESVITSTDWDDTIPTCKHNPDTNYVDLSTVTTGYISANGIYVSSDSLRCTDYIPMVEGKTYYRGTGIYSGNYYAFYDESKNVVASGSSLGDLSQSFVVPSGAVYGRFTILADVENSRIWISDKNFIPPTYEDSYYFGSKMSVAVKNALADISNPTDYNGMDIQAFDTCVCIGDSLTEGIFNYDNNGDTGYASIQSVSYPSALERITGIDVLNKGSSGLTSKEWYTSHQNDDLSGHKFAIVQFGVNDVIRYGQGWTQDSEDGYTGIINKLKTDNQNIKIFVSTVMPAVSYPPSNYVTYNAGLKSFIESLNDTNVILLDMAAYGNTAPGQYNAGHLSAYGYWRLAKDYANYISWYMHNNGMQFREIQFIGTNKHY